jgi:hypothetical protein
MFNWLRSIMNSGSVPGYFLQAVPITCVVGIIYVIIRVAIIKRNHLKVEWLKEIIRLLFSCYLTGLISLFDRTYKPCCPTCKLLVELF